MNIMGDFNLLQSPDLKTRSHYHYWLNVLLLVYNVTQSKEEPLRSCTSTSKTFVRLVIDENEFLQTDAFTMVTGYTYPITLLGLIGTDMKRHKRWIWRKTRRSIYRLRLYWLLFWYSDFDTLSAECSLIALWFLSECSLSALWVLSECSLSALWVLTECSLSAHWLLTYSWLNYEDWLL